ncbi:MAG: ClbS/DfsB family four-helix bundle protein [Anaerolineae bacterium]|nr:ClbS/DfsB family four-helix bundle protein [Anaerolineae bacterium]
MTPADPPPTKTELMKLIAQRRSELEALIAPLSEAQLTTPGPDGWAIKDHLAHIVAWEQSLLGLLNSVPRHQAMGISEEVYHSDVDVINRTIYERNTDRPLTDVLADFRQSHEAVLERLARMTDDDLRRPYAYYLPDEPDDNPSPNPPPVLGWIRGNTDEHYEEHIHWIQSLLGQGRAD